METRIRKPRIYDEEHYQDFDKLPELFEIKLGKNLLPLVYEENGAPLLEEITCCRNQFDDEYGISLPKIRIRDNRFQKPNEYIIYMNGSEMAKSSIELGMCLCMDTGAVVTPLDIEKWEKTKEPAFGMEAFIIPEDECEKFMNADYIVISPEHMIGVHLYEVIRKNRTKILNQCMINNLIDKVRIKNPDVITDVFFNNEFKTTDMKIVLNSLLEECIPIKDMNTILEAIADYIKQTQNLFELTEKIRQRLAYSFIPRYVDAEKNLHCISLSLNLTKLLSQKNQITANTEKPYFDISTEERQKLQKSINENVDLLCNKGYSIVILCLSEIRLPFATYIQHIMPDSVIISYEEVYSLSDKLNIEVEGEITIDE